MKAKANAVVSILRGTEIDAHGDEVDSETVVRTGVKASIGEKSRRVFLPSEGGYRVISRLVCMVGYEVDLRKDDRLRDEATGAVYHVVELATPMRVAGSLPDRIADLSRTI